MASLALILDTQWFGWFVNALMSPMSTILSGVVCQVPPAATFAFVDQHPSVGVSVDPPGWSQKVVGKPTGSWMATLFD